jgi:transposase, IS5 family
MPTAAEADAASRCMIERNDERSGFQLRNRLKRAFHKKAGLRILDMVKSNWVYRKLRNFRAGIESDISCLKRAYGLVRCLWRGLDHFTAYVWSSVVAYNLALFAHLKPT